MTGFLTLLSARIWQGAYNQTLAPGITRLLHASVFMAKRTSGFWQKVRMHRFLLNFFCT